MTHLSRRLLPLFLAAVSFVGIVPVSTALAASPQSASATADANKIDINTATPDQLKALKGVGDAYSARIIAGRPYTAKTQLLSRGIVPKATYDNIQALIVARTPKK